MTQERTLTICEAILIMTGKDPDEFPDHYLLSTALEDDEEVYLAWRVLLDCYGSQSWDDNLGQYVRDIPTKLSQDLVLEACKIYDASTRQEWVWRGDDWDYDRQELMDYYDLNGERGPTLARWLAEQEIQDGNIY